MSPASDKWVSTKTVDVVVCFVDIGGNVLFIMTIFGFLLANFHTTITKILKNSIIMDDHKYIS